MRVETIGNATLYLGDCAEILPTLSKVDAVITDPPYGIGESSKDHASRGKSKNGLGGGIYSRDYGKSEWDSAPPSSELMDALRAHCKYQAFFGGNYFQLPPTSCWLVWDKLNGDNDFADCELCWTNWPKAVRRITWRWHGMLRAGNEERHHPTQKPLEVMKWVIGLCPKAESILDPFMGSGTTGVAAVELGRKFVGIEREEKYFDLACNRIEQAYARPELFAPVANIPVQESFL